MGWLLPVLGVLVIIGGWMYMFMRQNREREANAPLRNEIQARVCLSTRLDRVSKLGEGGFRGTRGVWIDIRGPKRLVVGADAFMISMPQALREYVFTGRDSSIATSQAPSGLAKRDWIIITGQADGRQIQIAITKKEGLPEIWQALAGTGAALVLRMGNHPGLVTAPVITGDAPQVWHARRLADSQTTKREAPNSPALVAERGRGRSATAWSGQPRAVVPRRR
jgi:hypothetical protein